MTHQEWIADFVRRSNGFTLGRCRDACEEMREAFPELSEVRGHVHCVWGKRGHVWLRTADGQIADPARSQFPFPIEYEEWKPGDEVRVGKCMNCGEEIWRPTRNLGEIATECVCGPQCEESLRLEYA